MIVVVLPIQSLTQQQKKTGFCFHTLTHIFQIILSKEAKEGACTMRWLSRKSLTTGGILSALFLFASMLFPQMAYAHTVGSGQSAVGPAVDAYCTSPASGTLDRFYAYTGLNGFIHIYDVTSRTDYLTIQSTPGSPALVCWQGTLVAAWRANDGSNQLYIGNFACPAGKLCNIYGTTAFPHASTSGSPTFASDGHTMYLGWVGQDSSHHLNLLILVDLSHYSAQITFTDYTRDGAGLSFYYDVALHRLWVTWVASSGTPYINLGYLNGTSSQLVDQPHFSDYTSLAPGIYAYNGHIDFIWKGYTNSYIYTDYWNGSWHQNIQQSDTTIGPPAIDGTVNPTTVTTVFTGTNNTVYYDENAYSY